MDAWDETDVIGNKFNRLAIFQGVTSHKSDLYFGNDINDGRLFKIWFFNAEDGLE